LLDEENRSNVGTPKIWDKGFVVGGVG